MDASITDTYGENVDVDSFIVYQGKDGGSYHVKPSCATNPDVPPGLDAAADALDNVEMCRIGEIDDQLLPDKLCGNCASELVRFV